MPEEIARRKRLLFCRGLMPVPERNLRSLRHRRRPLLCGRILKIQVEHEFDECSSRYFLYTYIFPLCLLAPSITTLRISYFVTLHLGLVPFISSISMPLLATTSWAKGVGRVFLGLPALGSACESAVKASVVRDNVLSLFRMTEDRYAQ